MFICLLPRIQVYYKAHEREAKVMLSASGAEPD